MVNSWLFFADGDIEDLKEEIKELKKQIKEIKKKSD